MAKWLEHKLDGGVVRTKIRSALARNELWGASNSRLKPGDPGTLYRDTRRVSIATAPAGLTILDIFPLTFASVDPVVLVVCVDATSTYLYTTPTTGGSLTLRHTETGVATGASATRYLDEWIIGTSVANFLVTLGLDVLALGLVSPADHAATLGEVTSSLAGTDSQWDPASGEVDNVAYIITDFDSVRDVESFIQAVYYATINFADTGKHTVLVLPTSPYDAANTGRADSFRIYRHYFGRTPDYPDATLEMVEFAFNLGDTAANERVLPPIVAGMIAQVAHADGGTWTDDSEGTKLDPHLVFPSVYIEEGGQVAIYKRLRPPAPFVIGCEFQNSIVMNDGSSPIFFYTPAQQPEYSPTAFRLQFVGGGSDAPRGAVTIGETLVILLEDSVWSVAYLPQDGPAGETQGRVKTKICGREGPVSKRAWATVDTESGQVVVWLSRQGLRWTDGAGFDDACTDWSVAGAGLDPTELANAVMGVDAANTRIRLWVPDGTGDTVQWDFYYHPTLLKDSAHGPRLRAIGPTTIAGLVAGAAPIAFEGTDHLLTFDDSEVFNESGDQAIDPGVLDSGWLFFDEFPFATQIVRSVGVRAGAAPLTTATVRVIGVESDLEDNATSAPLKLVTEGFRQTELVVGVNGVRVEWSVTVTPDGTEEWSLSGVLLKTEGGRGGVAS